jgi:hypothetical protein
MYTDANKRACMHAGDLLETRKAIPALPHCVQRSDSDSDSDSDSFIRLKTDRQTVRQARMQTDRQTDRPTDR